jgi:hypothetical protein
MRNSNYIIGNQTSDLSACGLVPQTMWNLNERNNERFGCKWNKILKWVLKKYDGMAWTDLFCSKKGKGRPALTETLDPIKWEKFLDWRLKH